MKEYMQKEKKYTMANVKSAFKKTNEVIEDILDTFDIAYTDRLPEFSKNPTPEMKQADENFDKIYALMRLNKELIEKMK